MYNTWHLIVPVLNKYRPKKQDIIVPVLSMYRRLLPFCPEHFYYGRRQRSLKIGVLKVLMIAHGPCVYSHGPCVSFSIRICFFLYLWMKRLYATNDCCSSQSLLLTVKLVEQRMKGICVIYSFSLLDLGLEKVKILMVKMIHDA